MTRLRGAAAGALEGMGFVLVLGALVVFFTMPERALILGDPLLASGLLFAWMGDRPGAQH